MALEKWLEEQRLSLIAAGMGADEASKVIEWIRDNLPPGADPELWISEQPLAAVPSADLRELFLQARVAWYAADHIHPRYTRILDSAQVLDEQEAQREEITAIGGLLPLLWILNRGRYFTTRPLRPISLTALRRLFEAHLAAAEEELQMLVRAYFAEEIALATWQRSMAVAIRRYHLQFAALGGGGFRQLMPSDLATVQVLLRQEGQRLARFAQGLARGEISLLQALGRADWYAGTASVRFWELQADRLQPLRGQVLLERNMLRPAEHCETCLDLTDLGWQRQGVIPPPKVDRICQNGCKCYKLFRSVDRDEVPDWIGTKRGR